MNLVDLKEQMAHIEKVIRTERFRSMDGLGGEIPFWIASFPANLSENTDVEVELMVERLTRDGLCVCLVDLYEVCLEVLDSVMSPHDWKQLELKKGERKLLKYIQSTLDIQEVLVPKIRQKLDASQGDVLLVKGVGKTYPFVRSHTVLNNLQSVIIECPTLMFFPGEYDNTSLRLFGTLKDDNYYRAFNVLSFDLNQ